MLMNKNFFRRRKSCPFSGSKDKIDYKDIKTLSFKEVSILSDQNYKNSITKLSKTKNKIFKKLKK